MKNKAEEIVDRLVNDIEENHDIRVPGNERDFLSQKLYEELCILNEQLLLEIKRLKSPHEEVEELTEEDFALVPCSGDTSYYALREQSGRDKLIRLVRKFNSIGKGEA